MSVRLKAQARMYISWQKSLQNLTFHQRKFPNATADSTRATENPKEEIGKPTVAGNLIERVTVMPLGIIKLNEPTSPVRNEAQDREWAICNASIES